MTHLLVAPGLGTAGPLADLLVHLARSHAVFAHDEGLRPPAAVLSRPGSPWPPPRKWQAPVAWWVDDPADLPASLPPRVRLLLTARDDVDAAVPVIVVPSPSIDGSEWRPVAPFVRARWRRRFGLPDGLVAVVGVPGGRPMDDQTAADALFLCAAAVVGPSHVLRALALGTPTVCDAATAEVAGAVDGEHVVVATGDAARAAAEDLAAHGDRAALLARAGRRLVEVRNDMVGVARRLGAALALEPVGGPLRSRVPSALAELGTPLGAGVVGRVSDALASLSVDSPSSVVRAFRW